MGGLASGAVAEQGATANLPLRDPRTRYTSDPFPERKQPWPGRQSLAGCEAIVATAEKGLGTIDLLVNTATCQQSKEDIFPISDEQMVRTFGTNIFAYFRIAKPVAVDMVPGRMGAFGQEKPLGRAGLPRCS